MHQARFALLFFCLSANALRAQAPVFSSVSTRWNDSFVEWEIFVTPPDAPPAEAGEDVEEEFFGELKLRWLNMRDDFSEWDYEIGGVRGTIRQKWKDDPTQWELRSYDGSVVSMRIAWPGDFTEWRVTDNTTTLTLKSRWTNQLDEWLVQDASLGKFYLYTLRARDPRDWAIEDDLDESVSESMRFALIFLTLANSAPRM
jgi:hypothetical protein